MPVASKKLLTEVATDVRGRLQTAWQFDQDRWASPGKPLSYGQCAKSIPHLLDGLRSKGFTGVDPPIQRMFGRLAFANRHGVEPIYPHQWLHVDQFVFEITGDQHGLQAAEVVCAAPEELVEMGLDYQPYQTWNVWLEKGRWDQILVATDYILSSALQD